VALSEKIRLLAEANKLTGEQLFALLEREGLPFAELERWRRGALVEEGDGSAATSRLVRKLERELARKEKALAEAAALLVLKKTGETLGGRGRRHRRGERGLILSSIAEAAAAGAHSSAACRIAGLSLRTIQRWRRRPGGDDLRGGPRTCAANALSSQEISLVLKVMTSQLHTGGYSDRTGSAAGH